MSLLDTVKSTAPKHEDKDWGGGKWGDKGGEWGGGHKPHDGGWQPKHDDGGGKDHDGGGKSFDLTHIVKTVELDGNLSYDKKEYSESTKYSKDQVHEDKGSETTKSYKESEHDDGKYEKHSSSSEYKYSDKDFGEYSHDKENYTHNKDYTEQNFDASFSFGKTFESLDKGYGSEPHSGDTSGLLSGLA